MECRRWEEAGLLYTAGELGAGEARDFEAHCAACEECRSELISYRREHERFFTAEILGETPSARIDDEILRVCGDPRPRVRIATPFTFASFFRRQALVPAMLFVLGFISVGYIMMNRENARQIAGGQAGAAVVAVHQQNSQAAVPVAQTVSDSVKDSLSGDSGVNFSRTRGNLNDKGVVTVDLKK